MLSRHWGSLVHIGRAHRLRGTLASHCDWTEISGTNPLALPTLLKICVLANSANTHKSIFIESMFNNEYAISLEKPLKTFTAFLLYEEHFSLQLVAGACNRNCKATNAENSSPHQNLDDVT